MEIVILMNHYPFKTGETFFDNELKILSKKFNKVTIITGEKNTNAELFNLPRNVTFHIVNREYRKYRSVLVSLIKIFSLKTLKELLFAVRGLNQKINFDLIKRIFIYYVVSERNINWIKKNIKKDNEQIIFYSYWLSVNAYTLINLKKIGFTNVLVSRAHGFDAFIDRGYLPFRRELYSELDEIYFVSKNAMDSFKENILVKNKEKLASLYNFNLGVEKEDMDLLNPNKNKNEPFFHIVSCSSLINLKRIDLIIESLKLLEGYQIKWTHFGDGPLKNIYNKMICEVFGDSTISIELKGRVENSQLLKYYQSVHVDLFMNSSDYEGVPVSIMEALSYGIPVIARDVGGNNEIVYSYINGIIIEDPLPENFAKAIKYFINLDDSVMEDYKKNAYLIWLDKYNALDNYNSFGVHLSEINQ